MVTMMGMMSHDDVVGSWCLMMMLLLYGVSW